MAAWFFDRNRAVFPTAETGIDLGKGLFRRVRQEWQSACNDLRWMADIPLHVWLRIPVVIGIFALWSLVARVSPEGFFAGPILTLQALGLIIADNGQIYLIALGQTLLVYFSGLALAGIVGVALGTALGAQPLISRVFSPFVHAFAAMPVIALIPLVVLTMGLGAQAKIFIIALAAVMPILINTQTGVQSLDPELRQMALAHGMSRGRRILFLNLPAALPHIMAGLRLGSIAALSTAVIADIYTAMTGLGALLQTFGNSFRMDRYFAVVLTFAVIGALTTWLIGWLERRLDWPR